MLVLKRCFDGFADEDGAIPADNVGGILSMMGMKVKPSALRYKESWAERYLASPVTLTVVMQREMHGTEEVQDTEYTE